MGSAESAFVALVWARRGRTARRQEIGRGGWARWGISVRDGPGHKAGQPEVGESGMGVGRVCGSLLAILNECGSPEGHDDFVVRVDASSVRVSNRCLGRQ